MTEFSTRSMKRLIQEHTDKKVSKPLANDLADYLEAHVESRAMESLEITRENDRKTLRESDVNQSRDRSVKNYGFNLPKASVERILRMAGAERVSEEAITSMRDEVVSVGAELAQECKRVSNHADRKTLKRSDLDLAIGS